MKSNKCCISLLGHVDAGKTTLSEAILYETGEIRRIGRVDKKDAFLDCDVNERERGITIYSKSAVFKLGDDDFVLIDTPGHVDFSGEAERALSVLDGAVLLVSASDGVQGHTKTLWKLLKSLYIPTFIFVNKTDLPGFDKDKLLKNLRKELSVDITDFSGMGTPEFYEEIGAFSEDMLEEYLEKGSISDELIIQAVGERKLFPCLFGSALNNEGVSELLDAMKRFLPRRTYGDEFGALAYKITRDNDGTRLTHLKITGGSLKVKEMLGDEKVNELRIYSSDRYESVKEVLAGDIVVIPGLTESKPGMNYGASDIKLSRSLEPVLSYAVIFDKDADITRMHAIMKELEEAEPGLKVEYIEDLKEIHVCLMGEVQTEILKSEFKEKYGVNVNFGQGKISYRETITDVVEGVGHFEPLRHYAEVHLKLEPLERGSGLQFESTVSTDDLNLNWQRLVLTHLKEREHRGVLTGSPITDMKLTLVAGKAHIKHTEGGDFRQATYRAVRQGLMCAESVLLEPYYDFTLEVPDSMVGRAMTDLDRMFCTAVLTESALGTAVLNGSGPVSALNGYARDVMAYTRGLGRISLAVSGYRECHNPEEVLEKIGYNPEADLRNTPDSVFCSHGAGTVVPWNEVPSYMHLPYTIYGEEEAKESVVYISQTSPGERELFVSTEEIDEIIGKTSGANRKGRQSSYKGIPASMRERQRVGGRREEKETVYKGTEIKERFLLIDGYNVVHAWPELKELAARDLNAAAGRLMDIVANYQGLTGINTILVFDAYKVTDHSREIVNYFNITVVYTRTAETADRYIERYAHENGKKYDITVVTSDGMEQVIIRGAGCRLISSMEFLEEVNRSETLMREHSALSSDER